MGIGLIRPWIKTASIALKMRLDPITMQCQKNTQMRRRANERKIDQVRYIAIKKEKKRIKRTNGASPAVSSMKEKGNLTNVYGTRFHDP